MTRDIEVKAMYNVPVARKVCATCKWWRGGRKLKFIGGNLYAVEVDGIMPKGHICRAHGQSGYLHWSCDYNWKSNDFAKNGNEWLLYPSEEEPVYSVRMEYFRDGVEDYNLLALANRLPKSVREKLEREIAAVATDHTALAVCPELVAAIRRRVAEALEEENIQER